MVAGFAMDRPAECAAIPGPYFLNQWMQASVTVIVDIANLSYRNVRNFVRVVRSILGLQEAPALQVNERRPN
jgi:hypothetical protein